MFISREKDDDDDFFPNPKYKSNLASIFSNSADDGNSSLTYTAPKQPKAQNKAASSATQSTNATASAVLVAKTVQTFKMVDGAYQNQGKLGAVVVSSYVEKETTYQLLLYRDKRTHICIARINRDFRFHIQPKNYASFYDKHNGIWSILFDSSTDLVDFTLQVALARWKVGDSTTPLMAQDLWCPIMESSECVAEVGDNVELTYSILPIGMATEDTEESFTVWVEAEERGWKQALVGVRPSSRRVVILQPFMLGDLNPRENTYNSPVVVKFTVVKISKEVHQSAHLPAIPISEPPSSSLHAQPTTATAGITGSPKATKANLITRMARMGQALPFKTVTPTISDSDETEEDLSGRLLKTAPKPRTRLHHATPVVAASLTTSNVPTEMAGAAGPVASTLPSPVTILPHPLTMTQPYMMGSIYPTSQIDHNQTQFNMFFSEVRTTNSELRMGITRLTDKVDALHTKLGSPEKNQPNHEMMSVMERLLQHEQQLKEQLQIVINSFKNTHHPSGSGVSSVPSASSLTDSDHRPCTPAAPATSAVSVVDLCPSCTQLKETQVLMSERIKKLKEENECLQATSSALKSALENARIADQDQLVRIEDLQRELTEKRLSIIRLEERLETIEAEKKALSEDTEKKNNCMAELQKIILEKQSCIDRLEHAVSESEAKNIEEVRSGLKEVLDQKLIVEEHAKKILNAVFRLVKVQLQPQTNYNATKVLSMLADTIKAVTLEYLENGDFSVTQQKFDCTFKVHPEPLQDSSLPNQVMIEGQYVRKEQRSPMPVEAKLSAAICNEVASEPEIPALDNTSTPPPENELSVIVNNTERFHQEDSLTSIVLVDENEEGNPKESTSHPKATLRKDSSEVRGCSGLAKGRNVIRSCSDVSDLGLLDFSLGSSDDYEPQDDYDSDDSIYLVLKPQPPPPPLFEDEESDDTWLNS